MKLPEKYQDELMSILPEPYYPYAQTIDDKNILYCMHIWAAFLNTCTHECVKSQL